MKVVGSLVRLKVCVCACVHIPTWTVGRSVHPVSHTHTHTHTHTSTLISQTMYIGDRGVSFYKYPKRLFDCHATGLG